MKFTKIEKDNYLCDLKPGDLFEFKEMLYMLVNDESDINGCCKGVLLESGRIYVFQAHAKVESYKIKEIVYQ